MISILPSSLAWLSMVLSPNRNPEGGSSPSSEPWPPFLPPSSPVYKILSPDMRNGRALKAKQCHFWNSYLPHLATFTGKKFPSVLRVCSSIEVHSIGWQTHKAQCNTLFTVYLSSICSTFETQLVRLIEEQTLHNWYPLCFSI